MLIHVLLRVSLLRVSFWLAITCIHWTFAIDHTCRLLFSVRHILAMCSFRQTKFYIVDVCREYLDRNVQTTECPFIGFTQIQMENAKSSIKCSYKCNRWLSKSEEDHQIIRELPAIIQGKEPLPGNGQLTQEFVKLSVCVRSSMQWGTFGRLGLFEKWIAFSTGSITIWTGQRGSFCYLFTGQKFIWWIALFSL